MGRAVLSLQRDEQGNRSQKKQSESQNTKAFWAMKAGWDRGEEYYDPARKISWAEQKLAWICGKTTSKTRLWPWQQRWTAWKIPFSAGFWFVAWLPVRGGCTLQKMWEGPCWEGVWLCWIHRTQCVHSHHPAIGMSW